MTYEPIKEMLGKTMSSVYVSDNKDELIFVTEDGERFEFYHDQDCCEEIYIESVIGDLKDLVGSPILKAEVCENRDLSPGSQIQESWTWTFYHFVTAKGFVTARWLGTSNGFYSEKVSMRVVPGRRPQDDKCHRN